MRKILLSAALSTLLAFPAVACNGENAMKSVSKANSDFAVKLYHQIRKGKGNLLISPYSITSAIAMTYAGANGNTAKEMADVLSISSIVDPHEQYKKLRTALEKRESVKLHVANSLWPQKEYSFLKEYIRFTKEKYGVDITPVDYKKKTEKARTLINSWVSEKTMEKIPELIPSGTLNSLTKMVLVNAIYFKGDWKTPFKKQTTTTETFFKADGSSVKTKLMFKSEKFLYKEELGLQVIEMPYTDDNISMVVLLPNKKSGIVDLENALTLENLKKWISDLSLQKVNLHFPKFTLESGFLLGKKLAEMGMASAFNPNQADFSKMDGKKNNLFIGDVIHKTFIAVDEQGTEAAGATAVVMRAYASRPEPTPDFRADHPFIYLIMDRSTNTVLFMGRFSEPTEIVTEVAK